MRLKKLNLLVLNLVFFSVLNLFSLEKTEIIRVGYQPKDDLVLNIEKLTNKGFGYDVLKKVEELSNLRFEFIEIKGDPFDALDNDIVDIIGLYFYTEDRAKKYLFLETPLNEVQMSLISKDTLNIPYSNPESINGKTVATYYQNPANEELDSYLSEHTISVEYMKGNFHDYDEVDADLYMHYSSYDIDENYVNILNFSKRFTFFVSTYGNEAMMETLNDGIREIVNNESGYILELKNKYFRDSYHLFQRNLTADELTVLRSRVLKVAYEENHRPITYKDSNGKAAGATVAIMDMLSKMYGFTVEYYGYSNASTESLPDDIDIVISAIGDQKFILDNFKLSESFYDMQFLAILPQSLSNDAVTLESYWNKIAKIGMLEYYNVDKNTHLYGVPQMSIENFDTLELLLEAYEKEHIDVAIITQSGLSYANSFLMDSTPRFYPSEFNHSFSFGVANTIASEYIPLFNVMLDKISVEQYEEIFFNNTNTYVYKKTIMRMILNYWHYFVIVILLIVIVVRTYNTRQKKSAQEALIEAYSTDFLTGFMTMDKFSKTMQEVLSHANNNEYELISFDIDMFKTINMYFSSKKGEEVILEISNALKTLFENKTAYFTRNTGEHFLILRKVDTAISMEKIYFDNILPRLTKVLGNKFNFTMSFGSVLIENQNEKISAIIGYADAARVYGKNKHENTFYTFDDTMRKDFNNKLSVTLRMEQALLESEFVVVLQPKINFKNLKVDGAEALVRWRPNDGEQIYPDAFIPILEKNGFIFQLDMCVLEDVCKFLVDNQSVFDIPRISVNLSAVSVLNDYLDQQICDITSRYGLKPSQIELEVTESAIIGNEQRFVAKVNKMKSLGFLISIDDFGAGVSSLNRLGSIKADVLKLDKAFFDAVDSEEKMVVVVADVIKMAKGLEMSVVAEGVETLKQAQWLKGLECDYAQGYFFEKPMEKGEFLNLLKSKKSYGLEDTSPKSPTGLFDFGLNRY